MSTRANIFVCLFSKESFFHIINIDTREKLLMAFFL
jgi:hypothetical protein